MYRLINNGWEDRDYARPVRNLDQNLLIAIGVLEIPKINSG